MSKRKSLTRLSRVPNRVLAPVSPAKEEKEEAVYSYIRVKDVMLASLLWSVVVFVSDFFFFEPGIDWTRVITPLFVATGLVLLGPIGESKTILPEEV